MLGLDEGAGAVEAPGIADGKGVLRLGDKFENGTLRAKPKFGQRSKWEAKLKNTLDELTFPRVRRSVLLAPAPLSIIWYE